MLPFRDDNPTRTFPLVTVTLIVINVLVYLYMMSLEGRGGALEHFIHRTALTPRFLTTGEAPSGVLQPVWLTVLTSMFLHGSWLHLGGNMLYLWIFGNNIEDILGPTRFIIFYLVCGAIAALAQVYANPTSPVAMLGASGAVAGVLGAYLVRFPTARVQTCLFVFFFITIVRLPAIVLLGLWFLLQFASGMSDMRNGDDGGGVAWWAHIGGFLAGMLLVYLFAKPQRARYNSWE